MSKPVIVIVGSLNMDFIVSVKQLPSQGETVRGGDFRMIPGGKGANQACAAGKLGAASANTKMIGRVGHDIFADHLRASLAAAGVDVSAVHAAKSQPTGIALVCVEDSGQNSIVVAAGANNALFKNDVEAMRKVIRGARVALFQLETPLDTVAAALRVARQEGALTILDPAPAQPLSGELLSLVDILTPNESEACILLDRPAGQISIEEAPGMAGRILAEGPKQVILKLGDRGCFYHDGKRELRSPCFPVKAQDTTAAGDVFNGALAVALIEDKPMEKALAFANAAAAISVTRLGAQASIPARKEVDELLVSGGGELSS